MSVDLNLPTPGTSGVTENGTSWRRYGAGETLVLLHGVGMNKLVWKPEIEELSAHFDVLTLDMWGHGESRLPDHELTLTDYTTQVVELLDALGISAVHIAGHSMGGLVALDFAIHYPERCNSVAAINAVFSRSADQRAAVQKRAADLAEGKTTMNISETLERWFGETGSHEHESAEEICRKLLESVNPAGYAAAYKVFANSDEVHASELQDLKVPALFFTGELDPNSTPAMSEAMAGLVPGGQWAVLSGARHMMPLTAAQYVSDAIRDFIKYSESIKK